MSNTSRAPARTGARGPYTNGERRRAELVEAATIVFAEQGFRRISLRQIADALGTSHVTLLHHFGSKDTLLQAVLEQREEWDRPVRDVLLREHGLIAGIPEIMRRNATMRGLIHLDTTLRAEAIGPDHPAHDFLRQREAKFVAALLDELETARDSGEIRADLPLPIIARQLAVLIEGIQTHWLYDENVDMAEHVATFLHNLRADASGGHLGEPPLA